MASSQAAQYADMFAALGSEPRLEIMRLLFAAYPEGVTVGEIQEQVKIPNSTLSHHLEKLRHEKLVTSRKHKQFLYYSANAEAMQDLLSFLSTQKALTTTDTPINTTSGEDGFMQNNFFRFFESVFTNLLGSLSSRFYLSGYDRFSEKAMRVIHLAQLESRRLQHEFIGTEQILIGVLGVGDGICQQILNNLGVNLADVQQEVEKIIGRGKQISLVDVPFTPRAKRALELAVAESQKLHGNQIEAEHLLLGILQEGTTGGGGVAIRALQRLQVDLSSLEQSLRSAIS
ncbi:ArsR/SmtB family transcription factor [Calothrix sp. NIES-3974]|uniref:ArsR/SmtB family transcription factor n=1 Tax=Calothrix sp. NIES-3974 TaxID=2005462 RepID=UPI000B602C7B|nr:metalloregulator ArsR/SmtB family transcription factor [Calothrix sp. NIES-3974]BAZ04945.1 ATPase [Calothrix sp. NIES-3974]